MDVILPVAGLGSRLRPQTWSKPKPLITVAGKPMLEHVLDRVLPLSPVQLIFITGFLGDQIESWAKTTYKIPSVFIEQPEMLGQTDAIIRARDVASGETLILFPDMLFEADFSVLREASADVVVFTKEVDDPSIYGIAVEEGDRVVRLVEKPKEPISRKALIGMYWFKHIPDLYDAIELQMDRGIKLKNEYFLADAVQLMIDAGKMVVTAPVDIWEDCGNVETLLSTNRYLLNRVGSTVNHRNDTVVIAPSIVDSSAKIERSVIGPHASIGPGVAIRDSVVRDSIVDDGATIESAIVESSLIGRDAELKGRTARLNIGDKSVVEL